MGFKFNPFTGDLDIVGDTTNANTGFDGLFDLGERVGEDSIIDLGERIS